MKNYLVLVGLFLLIGCGKDRSFDRFTTGAPDVQINRDFIRYYPKYVEIYFYQSKPSSDVFEMRLGNKTNIKCYAQVNGIAIPLPTSEISVSVSGDIVTVLGLKSSFDSVGSLQISWD